MHLYLLLESNQIYVDCRVNPHELLNIVSTVCHSSTGDFEK